MVAAQYPLRTDSTVCDTILGRTYNPTTVASQQTQEGRCALQMVLYMQQQQHGRDGVDAQDGLSAFIHSTVTVRSLITGRIDKLRPSAQLTLKVAPFWLFSCRYRYMQCHRQCPQKC